MPVQCVFTALRTKWPVTRSAAIGTDSLCVVLSVCAQTTHNADTFCLFCFAKYQNTGIPASITSVITIVPIRE